MSDSQAVRLASRDWIWLLTVIVGAAVANMGSLHMIQSNLNKDMRDLDEKWQTRTERLARDLKLDLKEVKDGIPPDWFRQMVEQNRIDLRELRQQVNEHKHNGGS